jgi:hypothetical protein
MDKDFSFSQAGNIARITPERSFPHFRGNRHSPFLEPIDEKPQEYRPANSFKAICGQQ